MEIENTIDLLEDILGKYKDVIGEDFLPYKNHVYRVIHFCFLLRQDLKPAQKEKVIIAGAFHDLGIWTEDTLDYLPPSVNLAKAYLKQRNQKKWSAEIALMIDLHHKLRPVEEKNPSLVEVFRRADLIDVSLGKVKFGVSKEDIKNVRTTFPNSGFHKRLTQLAFRELFRHPLKPAPFLKW